MRVGFFSKKPKPDRGSGPIVAASDLARLPAIGQAAYLHSQSPPVTDLYLRGFIAAGPPSPDSPEWEAFCDALLRDLRRGAETAGDEWAFPGALYVAIDFFGGDGLSRPQFSAIVDRALPVLAAAGLTTSQIPFFLYERWGQLPGGPG